MAYIKTVWTDRQVQRPLTFTQTTNGDGSITLAPAEGTITQVGTPITADALNNMENELVYIDKNTPFLTPVGILNVPRQSVVIVNNAGVQNPASGVITKAGILTSVQIDVQSEWANATFTAKEKGTYFVRGYLEWASTTLPSNSQVLYLYKNGANYNSNMAVFGPNVRYASASCLIDLNKNDTVEFYFLQDSGSTQKTLSGARFEIAKIS